MQKKLITFLLGMLGLSAFCQEYDLSIQLVGIEKSKGKIYFSLHDDEDSFPSDNDKAIKTGVIEEFDSKAEITFEGLKKGTYAVSFFQDLNGNEKLDTNFIGIPKEPVGASNMTSLGRPNFSKCKFLVNKDSKISVKFMN